MPDFQSGLLTTAAAQPPCLICDPGERSLDISRVMGSGPKMLGSAWNDPTLRQIVRNRAGRYLKALRQLARRNMSTRQRRRHIYSLLRSFNAKLISLILAWPKHREPISWSEACDLARALDPRQDCQEPAALRSKAKPEGGVRLYWDFGPRRRALQRLTRDILEACLGPSELEYARAGRGRDAALQHLIKHAEQKGGSRWFVTADIRNCFGSFDKDALKRILPLPSAVVENCILIPERTANIGESSHTLEQAARLGLPQGSLASSFVASKLLEPTLMALTGSLVLIHGDDIIIGCKSKADAEANAQALSDLLEGHPAGPLLIKWQVADLGRPIDFLCYRLRRRWRKYGGGIRLVPSPKAFQRYEQRMFRRLVKLPISAMEQEAEAYSSRWKASQRMWDRSPAGDELMWLELHANILPGARYHVKSSGSVQ